MRGNVLGKGIEGMKTMENIQVTGMTIVFQINKKSMVEQVVGLPEFLPVNCSQLNLTTASGKKVCLKPENKKEVNQLALEFGLDSGRKADLN